MVVAAVVGLSHFAVLIALLEQRMPVKPISSAQTEMVEVTLPQVRSPPVLAIDGAVLQPAPVVHLDPPEFDAASIESGVDTDWRADGARAAAAVAAADKANVRQFGIAPGLPDKPRQIKSFGWDRAHTQRVEALAEGGIRIRLSDRCGLVLAPWPVGGCALGRIDARGDLFDGMTAPARLGD